MNTEYLIALISIVVEIVLGFVAKKHPKFKNQLIPIQNMI